MSDIGKAPRLLVVAGAQTQQDVRDVGGEKLIVWVKDSDRNLTGLVQQLK